jgi:hypothetical protein
MGTSGAVLTVDIELHQLTQLFYMATKITLEVIYHVINTNLNFLIFFIFIVMLCDMDDIWLSCRHLHTTKL